MHRLRFQLFSTFGCMLALLGTGCSTLGLSLYPSGSTLTSESKAVLDASRIPGGIARENAKQVLPSRVLQPGDALLVEPVNLERDLRLPADQIVLADGTLDLGPYGRLIVAGRDLEETESLIEQQIADQIRRQVSECEKYVSDRIDNSRRPEPVPEDCDSIAVNVRLLESVDRFYVLGEVNAPGAYPLSGSETVLDAIVSAGGLTSNANPCQILLARPTDPCECRVTLPVCYREIVQMGNTATNYQMQPGDRIFVASRSCLDELMFWRASRPCERCSGCNRACRNPQLVTAKPMAMVTNAMIPPGSVGWMRLANEVSGSDGMMETQSFPADQEGSLSDYLNTQEVEGETVDSTSDVDGELEFAPLSR